MKKLPEICSLAFLFILFTISGFAQQKHHYQTDFSAEDFNQRRAQIMESIGNNAFAIIQGSAGIPGFSVYRQSNTFYYLCGLETAHAYLLLNGKNKTSTLYLPHRDAGRERGEGKILSAEDAVLVKALTGVEQVKGLEEMSKDLVWMGLIRPPAPVLYTPMSPAEIGNDSRDELLKGQARAASDPWDGRPSREAHFMQLLQERFPQFEIRDLSPTLDLMRTIKSEKEIALIRKATRLSGLGLIEAMRSTAPGVYEYQLDAAAKYIYHLNGARGDGYASIIGGGTNAFMGHYFRKSDALKDGDMVLMDYAPDYHYYTSDVTRMWPVNGEYTDAQRKLCEYILAYRDALFKYIKPGVTSNEVLAAAARDMEDYLASHSFDNPAHQKAVEAGIKFRGHFQHPVGMAVHDVGRIHGIPLKAGMVFAIDPMIWIPEEQLYYRIEDIAVVTKDGVENISAFVPSRLEDIQRTIQEEGLVEFRPASLPAAQKQ
ncbi:MAG: Xaa-Pro aminopeptidase [Saprospiraceae bacterium]